MRSAIAAASGTAINRLTNPSRYPNSTIAKDKPDRMQTAIVAHELGYQHIGCDELTDRKYEGYDRYGNPLRPELLEGHSDPKPAGETSTPAQTSTSAQRF